MTVHACLIAASLAALGYFVGAIPFSLLLAKYVGGVDLRKTGSGNVGATNVARTLGFKWGAIALVLDSLKGALPTYFIPLWLVGESPALPHLRVLCGLSTILGHMYSIWLGLKGGKGVATGLGVVMVLAPISSLIALVAFVISFVTKRIVSLGSIIAATTFTISQIVRAWPDVFSGSHWSLTMFSIAIPLLIVYRHRQNIGRLWRGEEATLARPVKPDAL